jgi:hypothetical protein
VPTNSAALEFCRWFDSGDRCEWRKVNCALGSNLADALCPAAGADALTAN